MAGRRRNGQWRCRRFVDHRGRRKQQRQCRRCLQSPIVQRQAQPSRMRLRVTASLAAAAASEVALDNSDGRRSLPKLN